MIELILLLICSWKIHKLATELNLSPMSWVLRFFILFIGLVMLFSQVLLFLIPFDLKKDIIQNAQHILPYMPILYGLIILLYFFVRSRMKKIAEIYHSSPPEDSHPPSDENEDSKPPKKDLSYFR
jgi:hypothetical protein